MSLIIYNGNRPSQVCTSRGDRRTYVHRDPVAAGKTGTSGNETKGRGEGHCVVTDLGGAGWLTDTVPVPQGSGINPPPVVRWMVDGRRLLFFLFVSKLLICASVPSWAISPPGVGCLSPPLAPEVLGVGRLGAGVSPSAREVTAR